AHGAHSGTGQPDHIGAAHSAAADSGTAGHHQPAEHQSPLDSRLHRSHSGRQRCDRAAPDRLQPVSSRLSAENLAPGDKHLGEEMRSSPAGARRILFFPLGTVLGHFTRTLALAEELDAAGHEVVIAASNASRRIASVLPPRIRLVATREMYKRAAEHSGEIAHYSPGTANDRANLEISSRMDRAEQRRRNQRMTQMMTSDAAILSDVRPHAIITDYR